MSFPGLLDSFIQRAFVHAISTEAPTDQQYERDESCDGSTVLLCNNCHIDGMKMHARCTDEESANCGWRDLSVV
jgi:hypothetical protein